MIGFLLTVIAIETLIIVGGYLILRARVRRGSKVIEKLALRAEELREKLEGLKEEIVKDQEKMRANLTQLREEYNGLSNEELLEKLSQELEERREGKRDDQVS